MLEYFILSFFLLLKSTPSYVRFTTQMLVGMKHVGGAQTMDQNTRQIKYMQSDVNIHLRCRSVDEEGVGWPVESVT